MENLSKQQEKEVAKRMAKEFLESRLGIEATDINIQELAAYIMHLDKAVELHLLVGASLH